MDWDAVGAIGEVLGSVAVFVTLGYLAVQVKYARAETQRALGQGRSEAHRDLLAQQREGQVLEACLKADMALGAQHPAYLTALVERAGLTLEEALRVNHMCVAWWTYTLQIIPYVGELHAMERIGFENRVRGAYGRPGANRLFYETYVRASAHPDAIRYIDGVLTRPG